MREIIPLHRNQWADALLKVPEDLREQTRTLLKIYEAQQKHKKAVAAKELANMRANLGQ